MTVDEVRKALEEMKPDPHRMSTRSGVEDALVTEGLKVCDRYEATMWDEFSARNLDLIAAILHSAGRL
jgi:hypothetical protein